MYCPIQWKKTCESIVYCDFYWLCCSLWASWLTIMHLFLFCFVRFTPLTMISPIGHVWFDNSSNTSRYIFNNKKGTEFNISTPHRTSLRWIHPVYVVTHVLKMSTQIISVGSSFFNLWLHFLFTECPLKTNKIVIYFDTIHTNIVKSEIIVIKVIWAHLVNAHFYILSGTIIQYNSPRYYINIKQTTYILLYF